MLLGRAVSCSGVSPLHPVMGASTTLFHRRGNRVACLEIEIGLEHSLGTHASAPDPPHAGAPVGRRGATCQSLPSPRQPHTRSLMCKRTLAVTHPPMHSFPQLGGRTPTPSPRAKRVPANAPHAKTLWKRPADRCCSRFLHGHFGREGGRHTRPSRAGSSPPPSHSSCWRST